MPDDRQQKQKPRGDEKTPRRKSPPERRPPQRCRCVGHRAVLVFGNRRNRTIRAALAWTLQQTNVQHKVYYSSATGDRPRVPNAAGTDWESLRTPAGRIGHSRDLGRTFGDCCFFEEVLVMAHGNHPGLNDFLADGLGQVLQTRPVRKLTVWSCDSATDIYPSHSNNRHHYEKLCGLLQPKACPCNCDLTRCDGRCRDPDGRSRPGYRCPSVAEATTLYLAAWEDVTVGGRTKHIAAKLGIDPAGAGGQVLTSPDGRLREVSIAADGSTSMTLVSSAEVFAGIQVRADPALGHPRPARASSINATWRQAAVQAMPPTGLHGYTGPTAAGCRDREGCLPTP